MWPVICKLVRRCSIFTGGSKLQEKTMLKRFTPLCSASVLLVGAALAVAQYGTKDKVNTVATPEAPPAARRSA
jgi:hypothetical protein